MKLSVIAPVWNEEKSIDLFLGELFATLRNSYQEDFEVIIADDGSTDGSQDKLRQYAKKEKSLKLIFFYGHVGQTAALSAGIDAAKGEVLVLIDSDMENDPHDIEKLVSKLDEGFDVVSGWRQDRWKGETFKRRLPSLLANKLISKISGVNLNDFGCTLKAYRANMMKSVQLYGEMHRFIPALLHKHGASITELTVNHRPRQQGYSKYNFSRTYKVLLDLLVVKYLDRYMSKPIHFFGGLGFISFFLGALAALIAISLRVFGIKYLVETPLPVLSAFLLIVGVQLIALGIIGEVLARTYFESQGKKSYSIKSTVNLKS